MPAVAVTVDPTQLAALQRKLATIVPPALEHILGSAAPFVREQASAGAPVSTGALAASLASEVRGFEARVHSPLDYALPEEFGRKVKSSGGRGMAGRFFLRRAVQMLTQSELPRLFARAIAELEAAWARR
jgi:hypothetical protein